MGETELLNKALQLAEELSNTTIKLKEKELECSALKQENEWLKEKLKNKC